MVSGLCKSRRCDCQTLALPFFLRAWGTSQQHLMMRSNVKTGKNYVINKPSQPKTVHTMSLYHFFGGVWGHQMTFNIDKVPDPEYVFFCFQRFFRMITTATITQHDLHLGQPIPSWACPFIHQDFEYLSCWPIQWYLGGTQLCQDLYTQTLKKMIKTNPGT